MEGRAAEVGGAELQGEASIGGRVELQAMEACGGRAEQQAVDTCSRRIPAGRGYVQPPNSRSARRVPPPSSLPTHLSFLLYRLELQGGVPSPLFPR